MIPKKTYKDIVINHIYDGLMEGAYAPGDKILENTLSLELGLSRAPVREGLRELVSIGLLEYRPQVGNFVSALSPKEIIDSYVARGILEGFAVAQGIDTFTDEEIGRLEEMALRMERLARKNQRKALIELGRDFHTELFRHCTNAEIVNFTEQLSLKLHLLFYKHWASVYTPEEIRDRHLEIIRHLRRRDPDNLEKLMREHYIDTGNKVVAQIRGKQA